MQITRRDFPSLLARARRSKQYTLSARFSFRYDSGTDFEAALDQH